MEEKSVEQLVEEARRGDSDALEKIVLGIKDRIYGLAVRMLFLPSDAEDATQEILIKVITRLDRFRGESSFNTWVYRIASNYLLTTRKSRAERWSLTFEKYGDLIDEGISDPEYGTCSGPEKKILVEEGKIACLQGMLICMNREIRLAFILGEIFEVTGTEGARILDITPEAFRQRLSRGRRELKEFMEEKCSLVNPDNECHCEKQIPCDIKRGFIDPKNLLFAQHPCRAKQSEEVMNNLQELHELGRAAFHFRSLPEFAAPESFVDIVRELMDSDRFQILRA